MWASAYDLAIAPWLRAFGSEKVMAVAAEDLKAAPGRVLDAVYDFLGLDASEADPSYRVTEIVYANGKKKSRLPPPAACAQVRAFWRPHVACLERMFGAAEGDHPLLDAWSDCEE